MVVSIQVNMYVTQETTPKLPSLTFLSNFLKKVNMDIKDLMTPKNKISVQANELFCMIEFSKEKSRFNIYTYQYSLPLNILDRNLILFLSFYIHYNEYI